MKGASEFDDLANNGYTLPDDITKMIVHARCCVREDIVSGDDLRGRFVACKKNVSTMVSHFPDGDDSDCEGREKFEKLSFNDRRILFPLAIVSYAHYFAWLDYFKVNPASFKISPIDRDLINELCEVVPLVITEAEADQIDNTVLALKKIDKFEGRWWKPKSALNSTRQECVT